MRIYDALAKDHAKIKELLKELINLSEGEKDEKIRSNLILKIRDELIPHSRAEEIVFYNSLRSINSAKELVTHGYKEHMEAETTLRVLQVRDKIDMNWKETARQLKDILEHHIREEETNIFSAAQQLFTPEEANMLGEAFEKLKPEVQTEGVLNATLDLVATLMPQRFAESIRNRGLSPGEPKEQHAHQ